METENDQPTEDETKYVYAVWKTRHFQYTQFCDMPDEKPIIAACFKTREEAEELVDDLESGRYYLSFGEWARPDYRIRRHKSTTTAYREIGYRESASFGDLLKNPMWCN